MNYPSQSSVDYRNAKTTNKPSSQTQHKVYNSASEALEAYIAAYEKRPNFYTRRTSDLLAPKPKYYFMDSLERSLLGSPGKSPGQKVDDLVAWVNQTYNQSVQNVEPFGGSLRSKTHSRESRPLQRPYYSPTQRPADMDDMSSLPSAGSSLVDIDSNAETVETDVLLSSFKGDKPQDKYSRSNIYGNYPNTQSPSSSKSSAQSAQRSSSNFEYPSWVSHLGKEYPSWVEDLDNTALSKGSSKSPPPNITSNSKSFSDSNLYKMDRHQSRQLDELRLSDLKQQSPSKARTHKTHVSRVKDIKHGGKEWTDTASMDTDILVTQSIYGHYPINMGGNLHKSLYEDKQVTRLKKETTKKLRKSSDKSRSRARERTHERTPARDPPRSRSMNLTPQHTWPLSPQGYHSVPPKPSRGDMERDSSPSRYKDYSPLRSGDHSRSPGRLEARPKQVSLPVRGVNFQSTEIAPRDERTVSHSPLNYQSPIVMQSPSHYESQSHSKKSMSKRESRKSTGDRDGESSDTDRELRKSPTGIRMERMYREPTTMYPWKTMIQSRDESITPSHNQQTMSRNQPITTSRNHSQSRSQPIAPMQNELITPSRNYPQSRNHKSVAFTDEYEYTRGKPIYESTPAVRNQAVDYRERDHVPLRDSDFVRETGPNEYVTQRVTQYFPKRTPGFNNAPPPQPVFTSTERPATIHHKPPIAPKRTPKRGGHRRSRTMPDLRKVGTKSHHVHYGSRRRSYDDDMLSIVTSDTEVLVTQPSMPIVDASPSLSTVSDSSDTVVGSESGSEQDSVIYRGQTQSPSRSQKDVTFESALESRIDGEKFSPTSVFASSSPYAAVREELPKRYHLWKLDDDTTAPDSFIKKRHLPGDKTNIISSFLEDCLNIDDDSYDHNRNKIQSSSYHASSRLSGREAAPGPVEALKNMLFTMQYMAPHEDETPRSGENRKVHFQRNPIPADDVESINDDQSDASSQLFHGEESLQRAYHHLQRLKRLVGSEDEQSSMASEI